MRPLRRNDRKGRQECRSAAKVDVDLDTHLVRIESAQAGDALKRVIAEAGYSPEPV